jgi:hypothetical protein
VEIANDAAREFWGREHIRAWIAKEMVGDHVTLEPIEVVDNHGFYAVRCKFDGDYDKTNLPNPLIMTNYFRVRDGKIVTLFVIKNNDPQYRRRQLHTGYQAESADDVAAGSTRLTGS